MKRLRYLVTYDISDQKRGSAVYKIMLDFGDHTQFSVFVCELNKRELLQMEARLNAVINHREDQILIFNLGTISEESLEDVKSIGRSFEYLSKTFIV